MIYEINQEDIDISNEIADNSYISKPLRSGYIRMYNKNSFKTYYFRIIKKAENKRAWIVERKTKIPDYFSMIIKLIGE